MHDHLLESPREALIPTLLVHPLGPLIEFPVSVPKPAIAKLAATPAMSSVYLEAISHSKPPVIALSGECLATISLDSVYRIASVWHEVQ